MTVGSKEICYSKCGQWTSHANNIGILIEMQYPSNPPGSLPSLPQDLLTQDLYITGSPCDLCAHWG